MNHSGLSDFYRDKVILVTGGSGFIGSKIASALLKWRPKSVRLLDVNETGLYELENKIGSPTTRYFVGDVRLQRE